MKNILLLLGCIYTIPGPAQSAYSPLSAFCTGIGTYANDTNHVFDLRLNPASLANVQTCVGIVAEQKWAVKGVHRFEGLAAFQTQSGSWGVQMDYVGFSGFNRSAIALSYGRTLSKSVNIGTGFRLTGLRIPGYVRAAELSFDAGIRFHFSKKLHGGISIQNPVGINLYKQAEPLSFMLFRSGLGYEISEQFLLAAEIIKNEEASSSIQIAAQYHPVKELIVQTGLNIQEELFFAGVGIEYRSLNVQLMITRHPQLGLTPALALLFKRGSSAP